jgi:hypothetical protein
LSTHKCDIQPTANIFNSIKSKNKRLKEKYVPAIRGAVDTQRQFRVLAALKVVALEDRCAQQHISAPLCVDGRVLVAGRAQKREVEAEGVLGRLAVGVRRCQDE